MAVIEVENVHKRYGGTVAVDDVSFSVEEAEIFGILGPNGAGKTTTVESIAGLRTPDRGRISVLGLDPRRDADELRQLVGVQLQESQLPDKRDTKFGKLSGGQRQRLSVALALVGNPQIAVLDELTTGLDPQARRDTWALIANIRARGTTVLLVTHFMEEAERLCDRVAVIDAGRIVAIDSPAALATAVDAEQRISFRPSRPLDDQLLTRLPDVTDVRRQGETVLITGNGNMLNAVTSVLARNGIVARQLRVEQASLEDAFVALTGRNAHTAARDAGAVALDPSGAARDVRTAVHQLN